MPATLTYPGPGVCIEELPSGVGAITGVATSLTAFVDRALRGADAKPAKASLDANGLSLEAATPGAWGNKLRARVDTDVSADVATATFRKWH